MPQYEMVYLVRPDLEPDAVQAVVDRISQRVTEQGGTVDFLEVWGKRRLASPLRKFREGIYVLTRFTIDSTHIPEFKRLTRIMDEVMRLLIVEAEGPLPVAKAAPERSAEPREAPAPVAVVPAAETAGSTGE